MSDLNKHGKLLVLGSVSYDRKKKCMVIPWMDDVHTYVGFAYKYDDPGKEDELIYVVPLESGAMQFRIHRTTISFDDRFGVPQVALGSPVDPETDEILKDVNL